MKLSNYVNVLAPRNEDSSICLQPRRRKASIAHTWRLLTQLCTQEHTITIRFLVGTVIEIDDATREYMARYTNRKEYETVPHAMLRTVFSSVSFMAIATMQIC